MIPHITHRFADCEPFELICRAATSKGNFFRPCWRCLVQAILWPSPVKTPEAHGEAALRKMFVAAAWPEREFGVASKLLECLVEASRARGVRRIYLGTTAQFLAAHRFYEKHGFTLIDPQDLPTGFPLMAVDTRFYALLVWKGDA